MGPKLVKQRAKSPPNVRRYIQFGVQNKRCETLNLENSWLPTLGSFFLVRGVECIHAKIPTNLGCHMQLDPATRFEEKYLKATNMAVHNSVIRPIS